jgi:D-alanyl-D-alanine carboxypeptidase
MDNQIETNVEVPVVIPPVVPTESQTSISKKLLFLNIFLVALILGMVLLIYDMENTPVVAEAKLEETQVISNTAFDQIVLEAKAAYVYDIVNDAVLYQKNSAAQLPLASLTKLMTALTATELLPKNTDVTIKPEFLEEEGDNGLLPEESWKLKDLLDFSLVASSNDGVRSIASVVGAIDLKTDSFELGRQDFVKKMNSLAQGLNLKQTYFLNESGLDTGETSGGYGSAEDIEKLLEYILIHKPELLEATKYQSITVGSMNLSHVAKNTNIVSDKIPGLLASKTGYTRLAGGNLAVAFDPAVGRPIIIVVLGSTEKGRFSDMEKLVETTLAYISE